MYDDIDESALSYAVYSETFFGMCFEYTKSLAHDKSTVIDLVVLGAPCPDQDMNRF